MEFLKKNYSRILILLFLIVFIWSAIEPKEYSVWLFEISGVIFIVAVYIFFQIKINFSNTTNTWVFIGACLIAVGAHYSFPDVPGFNGINGIFKLDRNNFDKLGHIVQGILPVLISREVLVKKEVIKDFFWINFFSFCVAITVSALYELVEWLFIIVFGNNHFTYDVLGTQGYVWDAQSDILCALVGALLVTLFGRKHLLTLTNSKILLKTEK